jgi:hypothetical protein
LCRKEGTALKSNRLLVLGALTLSLYGCGGGSGGPTPVVTGDSLTRGRTQLEKVASGAQTADAPTLESIFALFTDALKTTPDKAEAHFGAAICLAGAIAQEADGQATGSGTGNSGGGAIGGPPPSNELPPAPPGDPTPPKPVPPHRTLGLFWNLDRGLSDPLVLLNMLAPVADLRFGFLPYYGYMQDNPARRQALLTRLDKVLQHLARVEADPNFTYTLPDADHNGQSVTITLAEVYLFDAYVQTLRAEIALSLAYIRDVGELPPMPPVVPQTGNTNGGRADSSLPVYLGRHVDKNKDGKLSPEEYLPPSPYLTLRDSALLQAAQQAMLAMEDKAKKGIELALARSGAGNFLLPNTTEMRAVLTRLRDTVLPLIKGAATGPVTLEIFRPYPMPFVLQGGGTNSPQRPNGAVLFAPAIWPGELPPDPPNPVREVVTINLAAWFAHPPTDLKAFAPTYTVSTEGWPQTPVYLDATFNGLFPDGLPLHFRF